MTREEAIKELRGFIGQLTEGCQEAIKALIPELRESEDERIRTFLHHTFTAQYLCKDKTGKWHGEPVTNILAYLEKQKENPDRLILIGKAKSEKQVVLLTESNGDENIYWDTKSEDDAVSLLEKGLKFFGKQKPAEWSEEDEEILYSIRSFLIQAEQSGKYGSIQIAQIEQCLNWLKSLRPQWKPSEEQMKALAKASENTYPVKDANILKSLYYKLQEL